MDVIVFENLLPSLSASEKAPTPVDVTASSVVDLDIVVVFYDDEPEQPYFPEEKKQEEANSDDIPAEVDVYFTDAVPKNPFEVENQGPIRINGPYFPFRDKIHQLVHHFYSWSGGDISKSLMENIVKLIHDVSEAKSEYPEVKLPAADLIFCCDDPRKSKNQILALTHMTHQVTIRRNKANNKVVQEQKSFTMKSPTEILQQLVVANPSVNGRLSRLSDQTEDELVDSYQSQKRETYEIF
ncbi:hypothetical protein MBANPS3_012418 [Mucor bainieri]